MTADQLLELQLTDSAIDQLRLRLPRLPEVTAAAAATAQVAEWERRAAELTKIAANHEAAIAAAEHANETLTTKRTRLESQLKTVISPREAEALMHEIATLNQQRSALDDDELLALDGLAEAEAQLLEHQASEERIRAGSASAGQSADEATTASAAELAALIAARDVLRPGIDAALLKRYDAMRRQLDGVAIAKLNGLRCEGCHLDMSRGELDEIKRQPPDALPECPNCGRLLAR